MRPITKALRPKFTLTKLQQAVAQSGGGAIYDPSTLWGAADHLPRRNLLVSTATLATQTRTVTAGSHTLYFKGTGSVTLSGVATGTLNGTGANDRVSLVFTATAGSLTLTVSSTVTEGHLTTTATTDHSYQAITDWVTEQYAWAAQKNVPWLRKNLLTNSVFANSGGAAPTGYSQVFSTGTSAPDGTDGAGNVIYSQAATAQRPLFQSSSFTWNAGITYVLSTTISTVSGLTAADVVRFASTPSGATVTYPVCAANPSGGIGGTLTTGRFEIRMTVGATAGSSVVYLGIGCNGAATGTLRFSSPQLEVASAASTYQPVGASWDAQYAANAAAAGVTLTMFQDSAGTTAVSGPDQPIGKLNDLSGNGYHAVQSGATGLKPVLRLSPNGYWWLQRDLSDDNLVVTFPNLGANCVTYVNDGAAVTETGSVTLNGATNLNTPAADYGRVYLASPSSKASQIIKWLKAKAGIA